MHIVIANLDFAVGGGSSHTLKLAKTLSRMGHSVSALVLWPIGDLYDSYCQVFDQLVVVPRRLEGRQSYFRRIVQTLAKLQPDAIINNEESLVQTTFTALHPHLVTITVLHGIRDGEVDICCSCPECTDLAVGVSENTAARLSSRLPKEKVAMIPVGVELPGTLPVKTDRERLELVYLGRVVRVAKNLPVLEKIVEELDRRHIAFRLTLIGDGDYRPVMEQNLAWAKTKGLVRFMGNRKPGEVAQLLAEMDVLLLTSTFEGTPHAVIEGMASGVIPVCSRISGSTDRIVEHGHTGYLCSTNAVDEYCAAIQTLLLDFGKRQRMSSQAQAEVRRRFNMEDLALQYVQQIERMLPSKTPMLSPDLPLVSPPQLGNYCAGVPAVLKLRVAWWLKRKLGANLPLPVRVQPKHLR